MYTYIQHVNMDILKKQKKKETLKKKTQRTKKHGMSQLYPHGSGLRHLAYHTVQGKS